ncbi:M20/M25/M40 family metallo-hydrolase [Streptomyces sp. NPDC007164]|uniref:M20/M25/M40 family metallo-hydrolase n=1 Tax=Streptomyces sp. NPDC007164 TaxID=3156918 RepID=UPI0033F100BC
MPAGRVLLAAHYDSVPIALGAADDGANVAAILEIARALKTGPQPRNDVELLFTDGEEPGLLGAQAFVDGEAGGHRATAHRQTVVVNMEGRGSSGPAMMFQMAGTGLTPALRESGALATSLSTAVYEQLPNYTDLTAFEEAGTRGLNFAFLDGSAHYHTEHDTISRLDRASVQDIGDAALAAVRQLGGADLSQIGADATYFSLFGTVVSYPAWLTLPLTVVAVLGVFLLLWLGRRHGLSPGGAGRAAAAFPLTLIGAAAIGLAGWWALGLARPDFVLSEGRVYHGGRYALGETLLLLMLLVAWYRWARRKASPLDITVGVPGWFALLALVCAVLLPGGAYLLTWPALIGPVVVAMALRFTPAESPWRTVAGAVTAVPAVALVLPVVLLLLPALGLSSTAAPLVLSALLGAMLLSLLELLPSRRAVTAGMLAVAVAGVGTLAVGTALDGYDADEPRPISLGYALESDTGKATWVSLGDTTQPGAGGLLTGEPARYDDRIPPLGGVALANGAAEVASLDTPRTQNASSTEANGVRTVRVRVQAHAKRPQHRRSRRDRRPPDLRRHRGGREAHRRTQALGEHLGLELQLRRSARRRHRRRHPCSWQGPPATPCGVHRSRPAGRSRRARPGRRPELGKLAVGRRPDLRRTDLPALTAPHERPATEIHPFWQPSQHVPVLLCPAGEWPAVFRGGDQRGEGRGGVVRRQPGWMRPAGGAAGTGVLRGAGRHPVRCRGGPGHRCPSWRTTGTDNWSRFTGRAGSIHSFVILRRCDPNP